MSLTKLQKIVAQTRWSYILSISLIALISGLSYWTTHVAIKQQQSDANTINIAGRQRMLSQRIALFAHRYLQASNSNALSTQDVEILHGNADLMLASHQTLLETTQEPSVKSLYFHGQPSLNERILNYVNEAKLLIKDDSTEILEKQKLSILNPLKINQLLEDLDTVVNEYELIANKKLQRLKALELVLFILKLFVLLGVAYFILRPSLNLIRSGMFRQKQKQDRMQLAANSAKIGIWEYRVASNELFWDKTMLSIFTDNTIHEHNDLFSVFKDHLHPQDRKAVLQLFYDSLNQQRAFHTQFRIWTKKGDIKYIQADAIVECDEAGNTTAIVGTNRDISIDKAKEKELMDAKTSAEHAANVKGDFLASMSHEIRTPMNGVMGMLELLKTTELNTIQSQRVNIALSSAKSLLALINDILDFSKIEANKLQLEPIDFNLRHLFGEIAESLSQFAESKQLELVLDTINVTETMVEGDPNRIRQLFSNLISNAIKFTNKGHVAIHINLEDRGINEWRMHFNVKDSGIGIPPDKQSHLFDAFSQADSSTTRRYGGTGLGLAIAKRLCNAMNGTISVTSEVNKGSDFHGYIQLGKSTQSSIVAPHYDISQLSILIVDDNEINREILSQQLSLWGANVSIASSAEQAIEVCETRASDPTLSMFDIGLLDMQMPYVSGEELCQRLKADERFFDIQLVLMTSMILNRDHKTIAELGFCGYFSKPVTTNDLFLALNVIGAKGEALEHASPLVTHDYLSSLHTDDTVSDEALRQDLKQHKHTNVLLVEDNPINQLVAQDMLEDLGLKVDIVSNGKDALKQLQAQDDTYYALIFMDCQMPIMDGYETSRRIRAGELNIPQNIPIIALTANAMKHDRDKCIDAGMNDFISKPMNIETVKQALKTWVIST